MGAVESAMEEALDAYRAATGDLLVAVSGSDDDAISDAVRRRGDLIELYRVAVVAWGSLPPSSRDPGVGERLQWRHARIAEADEEVFRAIRSMQSGISDDLSRVGVGRKVGKAYTGGGSSSSGAIVDGDG